jgi:hypothetical protein
MACYLLHHRHQPGECGVVFASFKGHHSPLRHQATLASCRSGGHAIWWTVMRATYRGHGPKTVCPRKRLAWNSTRYGAVIEEESWTIWKSSLV